LDGKTAVASICSAWANDGIGIVDLVGDHGFGPLPVEKLHGRSILAGLPDGELEGRWQPLVHRPAIGLCCSTLL